MIGLLSPESLVGLAPAFRDARNGEVHLATNADGTPSDVHDFAGLPEHWIVERDPHGEPLALHPAIVAGYRRGDRFLGIDDVLRPVADA